MARTALRDETVAQGARLSELIVKRRGSRSQESVAREARLSVETIRRIEQGVISNPGFFTVLAIAEALRISSKTLAAVGREQ